ncbi:MAG TPA: LacI family DNA-binding transcriptional regulator [Galbitalea sp.]|jgi:LacI family transcriptional regulator|nr:LacI family DNA-binding transcriptional regulator [Galbitalea sp.]
MSTLSDIAAQAGVSVSAVSRVLSKAPSSRVSEATRRRIEDVARELDYHPNFAARALKLSRTNVVALVVPDLTNAIFSELMRGVEEAAAELDYMVLLAREESVRPTAATIAKLVGEGRVDGILVQVGDDMTVDDLSGILDGAVPAVLINSRRDDHVGSVVLPDEEGAAVAVRHLVGLGHSAIGLVNGLPHTDSAIRRGIGFAAAMASAGLAINPVFITSLGYNPQQGRAAMQTLAALAERPTALVVANVNAALGLLAEARTLGIRVPDGLSIVAIHDTWTAENAWPPLTTVRMPLYELGKRSMTAIFDRIRAGATVDVVVDDPPPELVLRESTAPDRQIEPTNYE